MCSFFSNQKTGWALQFMPTPDFSSPPRRPLLLIWVLCGVRIVVHFRPRVLAFVVTLLYRGRSVGSLQYVVSLFYAFIRENHYWWLPCRVYRLHLAIIYKDAMHSCVWSQWELPLRKKKHIFSFHRCDSVDVFAILFSWQVPWQTVHMHARTHTPSDNCS